VTTTDAGYCWGFNDRGQIGDNSFTNANVPVEVSGGHAWASISAGSGHTCGTTITSNGYCWGYNGFGGLGNGSETDSNIPVEISGGHTWTSITAGGGLTCGITTTGNGYCWGYNGFGELGNGSEIDSNIPIEISGGHTWASINAGNSYTCGVTTAGGGYCWGFNDDGQLGNGTTDLPPGLTPTEISGGYTWASISVRQDHTCGVTTADDGHCWGGNGVGQIGDGEATVTSRLTPVEVITPWAP
jgi:alpha-tubulin suppressor-like RCC1 family protein